MSNEVTTAEIDLIRTNIEGLTLPDTCNLLTNTTEPDGQGGVTNSWGTATANVSCRMDRISGEEEQLADSIRPFARYMLTVPEATTIDEQYRVEHGGQTYNVVGVSDGGSWLGAIRALLEEV